MKKYTLLFAIILLAIFLSACGTTPDSNPATTFGQDETQSGSSPMNNPSGGALPELTQLVVGTFKLEGTEQAITSEQAADLLPLWQVYESLSTSDTSAQEEVDALLQQIQETMSDEQTQAIVDMKLDQEDLFALMQEQGISMGGQGNQEISPAQIATMQAQRESGGGFGPPPGEGGGFGPPDGGGPVFQGGDGQGLNPDQIATAQAARGSNGRGFNRVPPPLLNALITFLEKKAGS